MKRISILFFLSAVMFMSSFICVSAQEIDADSMDNEQLMNLVLQILQKLEQSEEDAEIPDPIPTPTPVPTEIPEPELSDDRAELEARKNPYKALNLTTKSAEFIGKGNSSFTFEFIDRVIRNECQDCAGKSAAMDPDGPAAFERIFADGQRIRNFLMVGLSADDHILQVNEG